MFKFFRAAAFSALLPSLAAGTAAAADPAFTPAQRDEIIAIVRQALKSDPSILRDAVESLQADNKAREASEQQNALAAKHQVLFNSFGDPEAGNPNGDVTVVEFYDPRCPYCRKMLPGIDALLAKDHGIRLVYKDIPVLGPPSTMEARAIVAAQKQGGYLKMQSGLMSNPAPPSDAMIADTARTAGLDADKLKADMESPATLARLKANLDLAHALKVTGTPTFVVGEMVIPGMVDASELEDAVAEARKHAGK
jgi:protein-disulfide isomerase